MVPRTIRPYRRVVLFFGGDSLDTEYEVRVLEINVEDIEKKLEELGAVFCWDHLQRRYVYDFIPKIDGRWIRLRTNGDKTTLTIKNIVSSTIDGTQELEIIEIGRASCRERV